MFNRRFQRITTVFDTAAEYRRDNRAVEYSWLRVIAVADWLRHDT